MEWFNNLQFHWVSSLRGCELGIGFLCGLGLGWVFDKLHVRFPFMF